MSLLCVTIKRATLQGATEEFHSYVTVKLQNVKSTTVAVRGAKPSWEQEFIFETNRLDQGLMVELWNKGVLWDKLIGVHYLPLYQVQYRAGPGAGAWLKIDQELETRNGQTVGTCKPTGHSVMVDVRFELPFEAQSADADEVQRRLQELNRFVENEGQIIQRAPFNHSGVSEDSDYTSDVSFPIHHQNNQSAHQWGSHLHPHAGPANSGIIQNPPFEEEFDAHPEDILSVSTNFQNSQDYQGDNYGLSNYSEPYNYETERSSPHGLRRYNDEPAYDNGQVYPTGYYDAYMHSIPEDEYKLEDNEGNVYSEDGRLGAYPTASSVERTSGEEYNTTPSYTDTSLHNQPRSNYTKPDRIVPNGTYDIHQQVYNEYAQYNDSTYNEGTPEEYDAELEDIEPQYMDRARRGLRRVQVQGEYGYEGQGEAGTSEYGNQEEGYLKRQYDFGNGYEERQYDSGKEFDTSGRQYDSKNEYDTRQYDSQTEYDATVPDVSNPDYVDDAQYGAVNPNYDSGKEYDTVNRQYGSQQGYDSNEQYDSAKEYDAVNNQFSAANDQYDALKDEVVLNRHYDSKNEFEVVHRQYDSGSQINDFHQQFEPDHPYDVKRQYDSDRQYDGAEQYDTEHYEPDGQYDTDQHGANETNVPYDKEGEFGEKQHYDNAQYDTTQYEDKIYDQTQYDATRYDSEPYQSQPEYDEKPQYDSGPYNEYEQYNDVNYNNKNLQYGSDEQKSEYGSARYHSHDDQTRPSSSGEKTGLSTPLNPVEVQDYKAQLAAAGRRYDSKPEEYDMATFVEHNQAYSDFEDRPRTYSQQNTDEERLSYSSRPLSQQHDQKDHKTGNGFLPQTQAINDANALAGIYVEEHDQQVPQQFTDFNHDIGDGFGEKSMEFKSTGRIDEYAKEVDEYGRTIENHVDEYNRPVENHVDEYGRPVSSQVDEYGRPLAPQLDEYGRPVPPQVDEYGRPVNNKVDEYGRPIQNHVDEYGRPVAGHVDEDGNQKVIDEYGRPVENHVDEYGRPLPLLDEYGQPITRPVEDGYQTEGEYRTDQEMELEQKPPRNYHELWKRAYQYMCEQHGIQAQVGWAVFRTVFPRFVASNLATGL
ncbi:unnamed protein product [Bursaphelenchus okinawaensis]|uniref:C2 domain-containing protein n=1 Tax=Bursaphelenchus okinawaensis TaxID=465554 RepID=A0A811JUB8_9BILA|nr:unnamed protein product [Bursaphelenchus okinawaensis]CAG9084267.1 unnamed protein product [Bursaphelenchus okinawaensis]